MDYVPIQQLDIEDYGCIKAAKFRLSPLHALIGPNDSGKSTVLRALRTALQFASGNFDGIQPIQPFDPMLEQSRSHQKIVVRYADDLSYELSASHQQTTERGYRRTEEFGRTERRAWNTFSFLRQTGLSDNLAKDLAERMTCATMVRFDPNALRRPSRQILASEPIRFLDDTGAGLASVYQAINSRDVDTFVAIRDRAKQHFPTVQSILVPSVEGNQVVLQVRLNDGTVVQAAAISEGLLYFLGYAALQYLERSSLFLVEEPENGLHPSRITDIVKILRDISKASQVVIATHSPLVINELQGDEVSVVTRDEGAGTRSILLSAVPGYADAMKVYQPGEFWLSYADGRQEAPLINGTPRT